MNCINTLRDLRDHINNTNGTKLPTAKALREGEAEVVALSSVGANAKLTVYQSGYFLYQVDGRTTVGAVDRCGDYQDEDDERYQLDAAMFDEENWTVRLMMEGEKRLKHNGDKRNSNIYSYSADDAELGDLRDPFDLEHELVEQDTVQWLLSHLTDRQRHAVDLCFIQGLSTRQAALHMGVRQQSVAELLNAAKKKLQKLI